MNMLVDSAVVPLMTEVEEPVQPRFVQSPLVVDKALVA